MLKFILVLSLVTFVTALDDHCAKSPGTVETNLKMKHFCVGCATEQDFINYSVQVSEEIANYLHMSLKYNFYLQRNQHCMANGCTKSGTNTVFKADFDASNFALDNG